MACKRCKWGLKRADNCQAEQLQRTFKNVRSSSCVDKATAMENGLLEYVPINEFSGEVQNDLRGGHLPAAPLKIRLWFPYFIPEFIMNPLLFDKSWDFKVVLHVHYCICSISASGEDLLDLGKRNCLQLVAERRSVITQKREPIVIFFNTPWHFERMALRNDVRITSLCSCIYIASCLLCECCWHTKCT